MLKKIRKLIYRLLYPYSYSSDALIRNLRKDGAEIGENVHFYKSWQTRIDKQNARFISIGNNCLITEGVIILAHDYSFAVVANQYNELLRRQRRTVIGNNVFLGVNAIVLMGSKIGDNCIIGAGSVVSGEVESNAVYAGNPARKICSLDEYYQKLKKEFPDSARIYAERCLDVNDMGIYLSLLDKDRFQKYLETKHFSGIDKQVLNKIKTDDYVHLEWDALKHK